MSKRPEVPFTQLREEIKNLLSSGDVEDFFIKNSAKPWMKWIPDYKKIREGVENRLMKSLIRQQNHVEDLVDEYLESGGDDGSSPFYNKDLIDESSSTKTSTSMEILSQPVPKMSSNASSSSRKKVPLISDPIVLSSDEDDNNVEVPQNLLPPTGAAAFDDMGDNLSLHGNEVSVSSLLDGKSDEDDEKNKVTSDNAEDDDSNKKTGEEVEEKNQSKEEEDSDGKTDEGEERKSNDENPKRGRGRPRKQVDSDQTEEKSKRTGNYKPPEKGAKISQYNKEENQLMWDFIEDCEPRAVINEEYIANSSHPCLKMLRRGSLGTARDNKSIWYKYQHRKDQSWFKKALQAKENAGEKKENEMKKTKTENKSLKEDNEQMKAQIKRLTEELSKAKEKRGGQHISSSSDSNNNTTSKESSPDESSDDDSLTQISAEESEKLKETEDMDESYVQNVGKGKDSSDEASGSDPVNVSTPNESFSGHPPEIAKIFGSNLSSLSETSYESTSKPPIPKIILKVSKDGLASGSIKAKSLSTSTEEKGASGKFAERIPVSTSGAGDGRAKRKESSGAEKSFRADRHPMEKCGLKRVALDDSSIVKNFNSNSHNEGVKVDSSVFVNIERMQKEKLNDYSIPMSTPKHAVQLEKNPQMPQFDFAAELFKESAKKMKETDANATEKGKGKGKGKGKSRKGND